jgi:hypothetical protein
MKQLTFKTPLRYFTKPGVYAVDVEIDALPLQPDT